jgi:6-phosphogluconolactonase
MNEATGIIDAFLVDETSGALTLFQSMDGRSPDQRAAPGLGADLHVSADGRFLYGSERAHDTISAYAIDAVSGALSHIQTVPVGTIPRSFAIDAAGRFLVAAGQGTRHVTVFAIDHASGQLTTPASYEADDRPIWVEIVELARR